MAYAIRLMSPTDHGMLVEMDGRTLKRIIDRQREADGMRDAYWDTPEPRHAMPDGLADTFPYFEPVPAYSAHRWVQNGQPHETLLWTEGGKIRRA